jgi:hypothetical protein
VCVPPPENSAWSWPRRYAWWRITRHDKREQKKARRLSYDDALSLRRGRAYMSGMEDALVKKALAQASRSAALADKGVVLDVTWVEVNAAEAIAVLDDFLRNIQGQSLVDSGRVADMVLDVRTLLTTERSNA